MSCASALLLYYFSNRGSLFSQAGLDQDFAIYISYIAGMKRVYHRAQLLVEIESCELFACAGLEP
jgi:hypothetical protein